jgi:hypothetical protein
LIVLNICTARDYPRDPVRLGERIGQPELPTLIRRFLYDQLNPNSEVSGQDIDLDQCPKFSGYSIYAYPSAVATFHAPSDLSGRHGMHHERIHAVSSWRHGPPRYDCVFVEKDPEQEGFQGLHAARVFLFFSFTYHSVSYPCALVHWFSPVDHRPCEDTGLWIVEPDILHDGTPLKAVIHLECILRSAHLIGVAGEDFLPQNFSCHYSLDAFQAFYVNKYADHHSNEIAF